MNHSSDERCLNCGRTDADVPISVWRYQGHDMHICSVCLPILIHERATLVVKLRAEVEKGAGITGDDDAQR
jgi:hypothetical protein